MSKIIPKPKEPYHRLVQGCYNDHARYSHMSEGWKRERMLEESMTIRIGHSEGLVLLRTRGFNLPPQEAVELVGNLVRCYNACAGLNPDKLEAFIKAAETLLEMNACNCPVDSPDEIMDGLQGEIRCQEHLVQDALFDLRGKVHP